MIKTGRAYFVDFPRRMEDLMLPHNINAEQEYEIVARVRLGATDFANFINDMAADRAFIEAHCARCSADDVYRCMLVQQIGRSDGVLIVPTDRCFVKFDACYKGV